MVTTAHQSASLDPLMFASGVVSRCIIPIAAETVMRSDTRNTARNALSARRSRMNEAISFVARTPPQHSEDPKHSRDPTQAEGGNGRNARDQVHPAPGSKITPAVVRP